MQRRTEQAFTIGRNRKEHSHITFLQSNVYSPKEGRRSETNTQPEGPELLRCLLSLQNRRHINLLRDTIRARDFLVRLDLRDAYLSIPIQEHHRRYLAFWWEDNPWVFTALPFG